MGLVRNVIMRDFARGRIPLRKTQMMRIFALLLAAALPARAVETKPPAAVLEIAHSPEDSPSSIPAKIARAYASLALAPQ